MKNTEHTSMIFEKNKDRCYTRSSLLYQDILKYSIDGKYKENNNKSFRLWNLTKWLLETNIEFITYFKVPSRWNYTISNRIMDRLPRIRRKVEDLIDLGLVMQTGMVKETKGEGSVPIFQFTIIGNLVSWIVESLNPSKREHAINQLYNLFQHHFRNNSSSTDIFYSIYYRKCREQGLFGEFVDRIKNLLESDVPIMNKQGFFQRLLILPKYNVNSKTDFWTLWNDSISELDPDTKLHFFHHIKLDLERKAEDECHAFKEFENIRFECRDNPNSVTVEGYCEDCRFYTIASLQLDKYVHYEFKAFPNQVIAVRTCPNCKKNGSFGFPVII
jgi:hypothetical protein